MATRTKRRDFMTSAQLEQPTILRVKLYNAALKRRMFAQDILAFPEHRDHRNVGGLLSTNHQVEFMDVCRRVHTTALSVPEKLREVPPAMRVMHALVFDATLQQKLAQAIDMFAEREPDLYYEVLCDLYGERQSPEVPENRHQSSSPR